MGRAKQIRMNPDMNSPKNPPSFFILSDEPAVDEPALLDCARASEEPEVYAIYANVGMGLLSEA